MTALIISGGDYAPVSGRDYGFVVACDRGWLHAQRMGIRPGLILGDFDSAPVPEGDIPVEIHPRQKDDTDTMLAMKKTLAQDCGEITVACGEDTEAWIFRDRSLAFPRRAGYSFSVFSLTDTCSATIAGAEYECRDLAIRNTFPVGVSNEWTGDTADLRFGEGILAVFLSGDA